jgi:drug/metabolite transporter (DMT)-like permease
MYLELGILAAFGAMLSWGMGDFLIQRATRRIGDLEALAFIGIIGTAGLLPFVLHDIPLLFEVRNMSLLLALGLIVFVSSMLDFEALKKGKLSVVEVTLEIELPVTVLLGLVFFYEVLSPMQTIMILMILAGIFLMAAKSDCSGSAKRIEKGVLLAILSAILMGFVNFLTAAGSKQVSPLMAIWIPWIIMSAISLALLMRRKELGKTLKNAAGSKRLIISMGIFDTAAWLLFAFAVLDNMLSITIAITESYPAVALLLGVFVNRERVAVHQYLGMGIALASSLALGFLI